MKKKKEVLNMYTRWVAYKFFKIHRKYRTTTTTTKRENHKHNRWLPTTYNTHGHQQLMWQTSYPQNSGFRTQAPTT